LETFDQLYEIPHDTTKKTGAYKEYVNGVLNYIIDFIKRAKPLVNVEHVAKRADNVKLISTFALISVEFLGV
jgi:hypothetical protein